MSNATAQISSELQKKHYPAIDPLRGLATLLVFICHYVIYARAVTEWAWVGVDIFFVLSGFLITGILFDSLGEDGYFKKFYIRRSLRIFPLYFSFWLAMFCLTPVLLIHWDWQMICNVFYVSNLIPYTTSWFLEFHRGRLHYLSFNVNHFWTLCVEEQFYMVWPLVVFWLRDRVRLMRACVAMVVIVFLLRLAMYQHFKTLTHSSIYLYSATFFRCDGLLIGAWVALWMRGAKISVDVLKRRVLKLSICATVLIAIAEAQCLMFFRSYHQLPTMMLPWPQTIGFTLIDILAACLLVACLIPETLIHRMLLRSRLDKLGRVSYGFYLIHHLPILFINGWFPTIAAYHLAVPVILALFFIFYGLALLSFRYIESPFLRLKNKYGKTKADPHPYPPPVRRTT